LRKTWPQGRGGYSECVSVVLVIQYDKSMRHIIQGVPLATEPGISLIILTPMKRLQRNLNRSTFVVWEMKRNVSVVRFKFRCNILISGKIIKEMPGSVASGTHCIVSCDLAGCTNIYFMVSYKRNDYREKIIERKMCFDFI